MKKYTTVEEQIEFGLDTISPDRIVEVSLRDFMYVFQTLSELNRFFHQPDHHQTLEQVERFLGNVDSGAYAAIHNCLYTVLPKSLPEDIDQSFGDGERFDNPNPPFYYEVDDTEK